MVAVPGSVMPSASVTHAIVEAVPISLQWPAPGIHAASSSSYSSSVILAGAELVGVAPQVGADRRARARGARPASTVPPVSMIAGTSALAAPISCAGCVLSQPPISTTASNG